MLFRSLLTVAVRQLEPSATYYRNLLGAQNERPQKGRFHVGEGAFVLGPAVDVMRAAGGNAEAKLIAGAAYDVAALTVATSLGVYKPGSRRERGWRARAGR